MSLPSYYIFFWPMLCLLFLFKVSKHNIHYHRRMVFINQERAMHGRFSPKVDQAFLDQFGPEDLTFAQIMLAGMWMCLGFCASWYGLMDIITKITFVEKHEGLMIMPGKEYLILPSVMFLILVFNVHYSLSLLRNFLDYCDFHAMCHKLHAAQHKETSYA